MPFASLPEPSPHQPLVVLVLCTGNSARSILAEALFNHLGHGLIEAHSAGSHPTGAVNPLALETLTVHGIAFPAARSKSWDEFAVAPAPVFDFIFTVCGNAANEPCPVWPGGPATVHWGIADPAHVEPPAARHAAFETAYAQLEQRIRAFLALPLETMAHEKFPEATQRECRASTVLALAARRIHEEIAQTEGF